MHRTPLYRRAHPIPVGVFTPSPAVVHRRRQVAAAILTTLFCAVLYGGTYGLAALLVFLGWCA